MKNLIPIFILFLASLCNLNSQVQFNMKFGASPGSSSAPAPLLVNRHNPFEEFQFNMIQAKPQFFYGISVHIPVSSPFFLEGGVSYTKSSSVYQMAYTYAIEGREPVHLMSGSEGKLLLPVNIGARIGSFEVTSGLSAITTIRESNDLHHMPGFSKENNGFRMGWQMGTRYAIGHTLLGIEYMGTLNRTGEGMSVNGQSLAIMNVPGNWVFSLQYRF